MRAHMDWVAGWLAGWFFLVHTQLSSTFRKCQGQIKRLTSELNMATAQAGAPPVPPGLWQMGHISRSISGVVFRQRSKGFRKIGGGGVGSPRQSVRAGLWIPCGRAAGPSGRVQVRDRAPLPGADRCKAAVLRPEGEDPEAARPPLGPAAGGGAGQVLGIRIPSVRWLASQLFAFHSSFSSLYFALFRVKSPRDSRPNHCTRVTGLTGWWRIFF